MYFGETQQAVPYGYPGMAQAPVQQEKFYNYLTPEEMESLKGKADQFSITPTSYEITRARCNHRSQNGEKDALIWDPNTGRVRCSICGYEFMPTDPDLSQDAIIEAKDKIVDLLQTIKLLFVDFNPDSAREFYQILPYIEKIPQLYDFAAKNFAKHDLNNTFFNQNYNMGTLAQFSQLQQMLGGGVVTTPGYQYQPQPMYQQPVYQQPAYAAGYPQQAYGYTPQPYQGFAPAPTQAPVAPTVAAPQAPAAAADTVVKQTVTV